MVSLCTKVLTSGPGHYRLMKHHLYELGHIPKMQFKWCVLIFKKHLKKNNSILKNTLIGMFSNCVHQ